MAAIVSGIGLGLSGTSAEALGQRGVFGRATQGAAGDAAYLNAATGNLILSDRDDFVAAVGVNVAVTRTYNAQGQLAADAWSFGLLKRVADFTGTLGTDGSSVTRLDGDGSQTVYRYDSARSLYVSFAGAGAADTLTQLADGSGRWRWTDGDTGATELYSRLEDGGRIARAFDRTAHGQGEAEAAGLTYHYHADGRLARVVDASGGTTHFDYSGAHLAQVRVQTVDAAGQPVDVSRVRYAYDALGRLTEVSTDLSPDDNSIADGNTYWVRYGYDGDSTRITSVAQKDGTALTIGYIQLGGDWRVAALTDGEGRTLRLDYDLLNRSTTATDALGFATVYAHDEQGRLLAVTGPAVDGVVQRTRYAYDADGNVTQIADGSGGVITMEYDADGNRTFERDAAGNTVVRTYAAKSGAAFGGPVSLLLTETVYRVPDADGPGPGQPAQPATTRHVYDARGRLRFTLSAAGRVTEYRYEHPQHASLRTAALQHGSTFDTSGLADTAVPSLAEMDAWVGTIDRQQARRTDLSYDLRGLVERTTTYAALAADGNGIVDGSESVQRFIYDQAGQLRQRIEVNVTTDDGTQLTTGDLTTAYLYDGLGRLLSTTDADHRVTLTTYFDAEQRAVTTLANGLMHTTLYDKSGAVVGLVQASPEAGTLGVTRHHYDGAGRLRMTTGPDGRRSHVLVDAAGRKSADIDADGSLTAYRYDAAGRLVHSRQYATAIDPARLVDAAGQPAAVMLDDVRPADDPADRQRWQAYDAAGRLVKTVDALGYVTHLEYDGAGQVVRETRHAQPIATAALGTRPAAADIQAASDPADRITRHWYDADGQRLATLDGEGYLSTYRHDAKGQLIETIAYAAQVAVALRGADLEAVRAAADDPASRDQHLRQYRLYDAQGRLRGELDGEGYLTEYAYDGAGNLITKTRYTVGGIAHADGLSVAALRPAADAGAQVWRYAYTRQHRLSMETEPDGTVTRHLYDAVGNLVSTTRALGTEDERTHAKRFDQQGRLIAELPPDAALILPYLETQADIDLLWESSSLRYAYDAAGRRIGMTDQLGNRTRYFYDEDGRLAATVNAAGEVERRHYDALNDLRAVVHYAARLTAADLEGLDGGRLDAALAARLDGLRDTARDGVQRYTYDRRGQLTLEEGAEQEQTRLDYNAFGEVAARSQRIDAAAALLQTYRYDRRGLLTATHQDPDGIAAYAATAYDAFGRATETRDFAGNVRKTGYDRLGRAVRVQTGGSQAAGTTTYDAFDRVVTQTDRLGHVTRYAYDVPQRAVTITSPEGVAHTVRHNRHGQQVQVSADNGVTTYYDYDLNGKLYMVSDDSAGPEQRVIHETRLYDSAGRLSFTIDGNGVYTEYQYDAIHRVLKKIVDPKSFDPNGLELTTSYTYDSRGRVLTVTDPNGVVTETEYDRAGQVKRITVDPKNEQHPHGLHLSTRFAYDGRGKTLQVTDPNGNVTRHVYDKLGRRTHDIVTLDGRQVETRYVYDAQNHLRTRIDGAGNQTRYVVDAEGRPLYEIDGAGGVTQTVYDAEGRIAEQRRYAQAIDAATLAALADEVTEGDFLAALQPTAADHVVRNVYDGDGRLVYTLDGRGAVVERSYDGAGNVIRTVGYAHTIPLATAATVEAVRDALALVRDAAHDVQTLQLYDARHRLSVAVDGAGAVTRYGYDGAGNLLAQHAYAAPLDAAALAALPARASRAEIAALLESHLPAADAGRDHQVRMVYDRANRRTAIATAQRAGADGTALWAVVRQTMDANGNVTARTAQAQWLSSATLPAMPAAHATPTEVAERTAQLAAWIATVPADAGADSTTYTTYDAANRAVFQVDALGTVTQRVYEGNVTREVTYAKTVAPAAAASAETIRAALTPAARRWEEWASWVDDGQNRISASVRDAAGRIVASVDAEGHVIHRKYDGIGNLVRTVAYAGDVAIDPVSLAGLDSIRAADVTRDRVESQIFNSSGYLTFKIDAAGYVKFYDTDALGRIKTVIEYADSVGAGTTADWINDFLPYLNAQTGPQRVTRNEFDAQGNLVRSTDAAGAAETYTYDALGHKTSFTNKRGTTWEYAYDAAGHLTVERAPAVEVTRGTVQVVNGKSVYTASTATVRAETRLAYDAFGNVTARTEAAGQPEQRTTRYAYDLAGRQVKTILPAVAVYDAAADKLNADIPKVDTAPVESSVTVTYDALGNAVMNEDVGGYRSHKVYDRAGRLAYEVDAKGQVTGYARDAFGNVTALTRYAVPVAAFANRTQPLSLAAVTQALQTIDHASDRVITTDYDRLNRAVKVREPQAFAFDQHSILGSDVFTAGKVTETRYTAFGEAAARSVYGADAQGNRTTQAADTRYYYDQRGAKTAQIEATGSGPQARGYLTVMEYDAAGNLTRQVEYANAASGWTETSHGTVQASTDDRDTRFAYDLNNRKVAETRVGVVHDAAGNGSNVRGDAVTRYRYDALGNLTSVTDALGNTSYSYYDALGRVTATAAPNAGSRTIVASLFAALLGRAPTLEELVKWVGDLDGGKTAAQAATEILAGAEAQGLYPSGQSNADFIAKLYQVAQGRMPDAEGAAYWNQVLATRSRGEVVVDIIDALTNYAGGNPAGHTSKELFNGKIAGYLQALVPYMPYEITGGLAPLTEFKRDIHGNVAQRIDYANGALFANGSAYGVLRADDAKDRKTSTEYDHRGNAARTVDAEGNAAFASYDAYGRAVKQWQTVSNADGTRQTVYKVSRYDALGQLAETLEPSATGTISTVNSYNAFGEMVGRSINGKQKEYYDYDNAGRIWRTNAGDGVTKVMLHDIAGNVTAELRSATLDLKSGYASAAAVAGIEGLMRTETRYDLQGRIVARILPDRTIETTKPSSMESAFVKAKVLQTTQVLSGGLDKNGDPTYIWAGANQVELAWSSLAGLGSGDVKVEIDYYPSIVDEEDTNDSGKYMAIFDASEAETGVVLSWSSRPAIEAIKSVKVSKKDVHGKWTSVFDRPPTGTFSNFLRIDAPDHPSTTIAVQYRPLSGGGWQDIPQEKLANFGDALLFDTANLADGDYEYQVLQHVAGAAEASVRESGLLSAAAPASRIGVAQLYITLLGRLPDGGGLHYWVNAVNSGVPLASVAAEMLRTEAANALYPSTASNAEFIDSLYRSIYDYAPDAGTRDALASRLAGLTMVMSEQGMNVDQARIQARGKIAVELINGLSGYWGSDATTQAARALFDDKIEVALAYAIKLKGNSVAAGKELLAKVTAEGKAAALQAAEAAVVIEQQRRQITQLYIGVLNRAPGVTGLNFWVGALRSGVSLDSIAQSMLDDVEGRKVLPPTLNNDQFLASIYKNVLGRALDADDATKWKGHLDNGKTRGQVIREIIDSTLDYAGVDAKELSAQKLLNNKIAIGLTYAVDMAGTEPATARALIANATAAATAMDAAKAVQEATALLDTQAGLRVAAAKASATAAAAAAAATPLEQQRTMIARLYAGILNRAPDISGLNYWVERLTADLTPEVTMEKRYWAIAQEFLDSSTGKELFPATLSNEEFVTRIYQTALGRTPEPEGLVHWRDKLVVGQAQGGETARTIRGQVATEIFSAAAGYTGTEAGALNSQRLFHNKVVVGLTYSVDMGGDDPIAAAKINALVTATDTSAANAETDKAIAAAAMKAAGDAALATAAAATNATTIVRASDALRQAVLDTGAAEAMAGASPTAKLVLQYMQLHVALFGRAPAFTDMRRSVDALANNKTTLVKLAEEMLNTSELRTVYPAGMSNRDFLAEFYRRAQGRNPEAGGLEFWAGAMNTLSRAQTVVEIVGIAANYVGSVQEGLYSRAFLSKNVSDAFASMSSSASTAIGFAEADAKAAQDVATAAKAAADTARTQAATVSGTADLTMADRRLQVIRIYVALAGRAPTLAEIDEAVEKMTNSNVSIGEIAHGILSTAEVQARYPDNLSNDDFITRFYQQELGRTPDAGGFEFWTTALNNNYSRGAIVASIVDAVVTYNGTDEAPLGSTRLFDSKVASAMVQVAAAAEQAVATAQLDKEKAELAAKAKADALALVKAEETALLEKERIVKEAFNTLNTTPVQQHLQLTRLYVTVLGRAPDLDGYNFWLKAMASGVSAAHIAGVMLETPQAQLLYSSSLSNTEFITKFYQEGLKREPEAEGLAFWSEALNTHSRGKIVADILDAVANYRGTHPAASAAQKLLGERVEAASRTVHIDAQAAVTKARTDAVDAATRATKAAEDAQLAKSDAELAAQRASDAANALTAVSTAGTRKHLELTRLYVAILGREPDLEGFNFWYAAMQSGTTAAHIAGVMLETPQAQQLYSSSLSNTEFITRFYQNALGRTPDPEGLKFWADALNTHSRGKIVADIIEAVVNYSGTHEGAIGSQQLLDQKVESASRLLAQAAESAITAAANKQAAAQTAANTAIEQLKSARSTAEQAASSASTAAGDAEAIRNAANTNAPSWENRVLITQVYLALKNRAPSLSELNDQIATGKSAAVIAQEMLDRGETVYASNLSNRDFITAFYQTALGRTPDAGGLQFWSDALASNSRGKIVVDILDAVMRYNGTHEGALGSHRLFTDKVVSALTTLTQQAPLARDSASAAVTEAGKAVTQAEGEANTANENLRVAKEEYQRLVNLTQQPATDAANANSLAINTATAQDRLQLTRAYVALLNRAPEVSGFNFWLGALTSGTSLANIAQSMLNGSEAQAIYPSSLSNSDFITKFYQTALGRTPDQEGLNFWAGALNSQTRGQVVVDIIDAVVRYTGTHMGGAGSRKFFERNVSTALNSLRSAIDTYAADMSRAETDARNAVDTAKGILDARKATAAQKAIDKTNADTAVTNATPGADLATAALATDLGLRRQVAMLYTTLFGRTPDLGAVKNGVPYLQGSSMTDYAAAILASGEGQARFPSSLSNRDFIYQFYQQALGRAPDQGGWDFWTEALNSHSRAKIAVDIMNAASTYSGSDSQAIYSRDLLNGRVSTALNEIVSTANNLIKIKTDAVTLQQQAIEAKRVADEAVIVADNDYQRAIRDRDAAIETASKANAAKYPTSVAQSAANAEATLADVHYNAVVQYANVEPLQKIADEKALKLKTARSDLTKANDNLNAAIAAMTAVNAALNVVNAKAAAMSAANTLAAANLAVSKAEEAAKAAGDALTQAGKDLDAARAASTAAAEAVVAAAATVRAAAATADASRAADQAAKAATLAKDLSGLLTTLNGIVTEAEAAENADEDAMIAAAAAIVAAQAAADAAIANEAAAKASKLASDAAKLALDAAAALTNATATSAQIVVAKSTAAQAYADAAQRFADAIVAAIQSTQLIDNAAKTAAGAASALATATERTRVAAADLASAIAAAQQASQEARLRTTVTQLYVALLNRAPDLEGLNNAVVALKGGYSLTGFANDIIASNEAHALYPAGMSSADFITKLYRTMQGRDPDAGGLAHWVKDLETRSKGEVAVEIINIVNGYVGNAQVQATSRNFFDNAVAKALEAVAAVASAAITPDKVAEVTAKAITKALTEARAAAATADAAAAAAAAATPYAGYAKQVTELYIALLNRTPDFAGFATAIGDLAAGKSIEEIGQSLLDSEEGMALHPAGQSAADFVGQVYRFALGRDPEAEGLAFWTAAAASQSRTKLAISILDGVPGYAGPKAFGLASQHWLENRVIAALDTIKAESADTTNGIAGIEAAAKLAKDAAAAAVLLAKQPIPENKVATLSTAGHKSTFVAADVKITPQMTQTVDRWGNVTAQSDIRNSNWITRYEYNGANQMAAKYIDTANGGRQVLQAYTFDALGRQVSSTDANGNINRVKYDANGRVIAEIQADANDKGGVVRYTYDAFGERIEKRDAADVKTTYEYDRLGRLTGQTTSPVEVRVIGGSAERRNVYDRPEQARTEALTTRYVYDELGRRIKTIDTAGNASTLKYDAQGNVIVSTDRRGKQTTSNYDEFGNKVFEQNANGATQRWTFKDAFGRVESHVDMSQQVTRYEYDLAGQLKKQTSDYYRQNLEYRWNLGHLEGIDDRATGKKTSYSYDLAGNRLTEKTTVKVTKPDGTSRERAVQDNRITYDRFGRVTTIDDARHHVEYEYDANGNRIHQITRYTDDQGNDVELNVWNAYDKMNRQTVVDGVKLEGGKIDINDKQGHRVAYDHAGKRVSDTYWGKCAVTTVTTHTTDNDGGTWTTTTTNVRVEDGYTTEKFDYDAAGRLETIYRDDIAVDTLRYDAAGNVAIRGPGSSPGVNGDILRQLGASDEVRTSTYDNDGRLENQTIMRGSQHLADIHYWYDGTGNLERQQTYIDQGSNSYENFYRYHYAARGAYLQERIEAWVERGGTVQSRAETVSTLDANGHTVHVKQTQTKDNQTTVKVERALVNDTAGLLLEKTQSGVKTHSLIVNGELIGQSGGRTKENEALQNFSASYEPVGAQADQSSYTVRGGESLQGIAKAVWGDATLWYLIADANGLTGEETLEAGEVIRIPSKGGTIHNDYQTFRPYDASKAVGETTPELLPPPAPAGKNCGGVGQILMIVVAVAAAVVTAGAATVLMAGGSFAGVGIGQLAAIGAYAMGGSLGAVGMAAAAIGGAVGSIASQGLAIAAGKQDEFNWKGVALSALSAGATAGVGSALGPIGQSVQGFERVATTAARAAIGNTITQGVAVATGLQDKFLWNNVAASAAGAGVGAGTTMALGDTFGQGFGGQLARGTISGFAGGLTAAVMRGGRVVVEQVARDAFGNALGNAITEKMQQSWQDEKLAQRNSEIQEQNFRRRKIAFQSLTESTESNMDVRSSILFGTDDQSDGGMMKVGYLTTKDKISTESLAALKDPATLSNSEKLWTIYGTALRNSNAMIAGLSPEDTSMQIAKIYQGVFAADDTAVWFGFAPYAVAKVGQTYADLKSLGIVDSNSAAVIREGFFAGNKGIFNSMFTAEQIYQAGGTAAIKAMQDVGINFGGKLVDGKTNGYENVLVASFELRDQAKALRAAGDYVNAAKALETSLVNSADFEQRIVIQQYYEKSYTIRKTDGTPYTDTLANALVKMQAAGVDLARSVAERAAKSVGGVGGWLLSKQAGDKAADYARNTIQEKTRVTVLGRSSEGSIFRGTDVSDVNQRMPFVYSAAKDYLHTYGQTINGLNWRQRILMDQRNILQSVYGIKIYQPPHTAPALPGATFIRT